MALVSRLLTFLAVAYFATGAILWAFQSQFLYPAPQEPAPLTQGYTEVAIETGDGLVLRAFYRKADAGRPTIVYFHGNGGTLSGASVSNRALVDAGIGALLVEYRGYGGNPGEPSEQGLYRDGEAAMRWLALQGLDRGKLVVIGNSIGSGIATEMALRHDAAGLVLIAPFSSLPEAVQSNIWWMPSGWLVEDQYRNAEKIADFAKPVLVQHGREDDLVPFDHGRQLAGLAPEGEFQAFAKAGHALSFERRSQEARRDWILARFALD